jgi:hypothetical protein
MGAGQNTHASIPVVVAIYVKSRAAKSGCLGLECQKAILH